MKLKEEIAAIEQEVIEIRRDIHRHPELGRQEFRTSQLVEDYLNELGLDEVKRVYNTGILGVLKGAKPGKTLLMRADMDALPVQEETGLPYQSETPGVMHACGHDCHTAMLLGAAKVLAAHKDELCGTVKFVFEPDEEGDEDTGAGHMVAEGVLENPKVDASLGMHIWTPLDNGKIGISAGPCWAEMYTFHIVLKGKSGHTAQPHEAIDPIICASAIIQAVQAIQTREINLRETTVIAFGSIHGGTASNIIPDTVEMRGTMRYLYDGADDKPQHPRKRFERIVKSVAEAYRIDAEVTFGFSNYAVINDPDFVNFMKGDVLSKIAPAEQVVPFVTMSGETFSEYVNHNNIPGASVFLGTGEAAIGTDYPHHHSKFCIDEKNLKTGVEIYARTALEFLSEE